MKVRDFYPKAEIKDWEELLYSAEEKAYRDKDTVFVDKLLYRYEQYGLDMYIDDEQLARLQKLVEGEGS